MNKCDNGYGTTEHALKSAHDALWAIANMQITENTDKGEVLALCMSIAHIELEKYSTLGVSDGAGKRSPYEHR